MNSLVARVIFATAVMIGAMVFLTTSSIRTVGAVGDDMAIVTNDISVKMRHAINFRGSVHDRAILIRDVVLATSASDQQASLAEIDRLRAFYNESAGPMADLFADAVPETPDEITLMAAIEEVQARTIPIVNEIIGLVEGGDVIAAEAMLMEQARPAFIDWLAAINAFLDYQEVRSGIIDARVGDSVASFGETSMYLLIGGLAVAIASLALLLLSLRPLTSLQRSIQRIAEGDLDVDVGEGGAREVREIRQSMHNMLGALRQEAARSQEMQRLSDDLGDVLEQVNNGEASVRLDTPVSGADMVQLKTSINMLMTSIDQGLGATREFVAQLAAGDLTYRMSGAESGAFAQVQHDANLAADALADLLGQMKTSAGRQSQSASQIEQRINAISSESSQSAATLEETVAAIEELTQSVRASSSAAQNANTNLTVTREKMDACASGVEATVAAMKEIATASSEISKIIEIIDDISFQTNLLSLNSGVEAARAGEAGKGFAVVASEVRSLAQRSKEAADTIKDLVDRARGNVDRGVTLVNETGSAIFDMRDAVRDGVDRVSEMAQATVEQTANIELLATTATSLDQSVQKNAVTLSEAADSLRRVAQDSESNAGLAARFKTDFDGSFRGVA